MAATEEQALILRVTTVDSAKSVGDLRNNIKQLNDILNQTSKTIDENGKVTEKATLDDEQFSQAVRQLTENQNALRNAMNATSGTFEQATTAAKGIGNTYNALVAQMKSLKQQIRNVDVSTEEGKQKFTDLALQIDSLNTQLKDMDAEMGSHVRNVGNYTSAFDNFSEVVKGMPHTFGALGNAARDVDKSFKLIGTNPVMGIVFLLAPVIQAIIAKVKESESALGGVKKLMDAMKPVFDAFEWVIEKIGEWFARLVDRAVEWGNKMSGTMKNIVAGAVGVGNAILQFLLSPIRAVIDAAKGLGETMKHVFKGQFKQAAAAAKDALSSIGEDFRKGFNFKSTFAAGKEAGEAFIAGLGNSKKKAKGEGRAVAEEFADGFDEELEAMMAETDKAIEDEFAKWDEAAKKAAEAAKQTLDQNLRDREQYTKNALAWNQILEDDESTRAANAYEIQRAANEQRLELLRQYQEEAMEAMDYEGAAAAAQEAEQLEIQMMIDANAEKKRLREEDAQNAKDSAAQRIQVFQAAAGAISSILGSVADAYESEAEDNEKAAQKVKALRISAAVIDTISGALAAYTSAQSLGFPMGPIIGAITSAAVIAAGAVQIAKIKSTKVGKGDSSGSGSSGVVGASVAAPAAAVNLPEVRNVTTATEEDRMERMASKQKVYILNSDLEANEDYHKTQVEEATF